MTNSLNTLFQRDLDKVTTELSEYKEENQIWVINKHISNSAGNLALHICGNLQYYVGTILGNSDYIRNRELEFSSSSVPLNRIKKEIIITKEVVNSILTTITPATLQQGYPIEIFGHPMTTEFFLLHLSTHLSYHLGQINYHRRLLSTH
ncbi:MAG: DinB family protein [Cyclobacteriaceae bacterium]|nr:DinB family protein [Cyclobacteriaceae bacterium]